MKKLLVWALIAVILFSLFGCAKTEESVEESLPEVSEESQISESEPVDLAKGKTIACCMGSINHPVHRVVQYGFCTKAEELGMNPIVSGLSEGSQQELIDKWESDIAQNNVSGIMLWTGDDSCYEMMKELKQKGIYTIVPLFCHDYNTTNPFIDVNPWCSYSDCGIEMADRLTEVLTERGISQGTVIISIQGPGLIESSALNDGFRKRIAELDVNFIVPDNIMLGAEIDSATGRAIKTLEENEDVVAVVGFYELDAQAWVNAAEHCKKDIVIIGIGSNDRSISLIENEKIDALITEPRYESGAQSAEYLHSLINGELYNNSENNWAPKLPVNIAYPGGEGVNDIQTYRDIYNAAQAYFE